MLNYYCKGGCTIQGSAPSTTHHASCVNTTKISVQTFNSSSENFFIFEEGARISLRFTSVIIDKYTGCSYQADDSFDCRLVGGKLSAHVMRLVQHDYWNTQIKEWNCWLGACELWPFLSIITGLLSFSLWKLCISSSVPILGTEVSLPKTQKL